MRKANKFMIYLFLAVFFKSTNVWAFPIPTFSAPEIFQTISQYISQVSSTNSEITSTKDLIKKGVLAGVPGYLSAIQAGDWQGLAKNAAQDGYDIYKADQDLKKKAKEEAQKKADEGAKEKAKAQKEGTEAAEKAVDENREKSAKNKESKYKKVLSWGKKQGTTIGSWLNKDKNKQGVGKITHGLLGDSQASSAMTKAMDTLSKQAAEEEEKNKNNGNDKDNKENKK